MSSHSADAREGHRKPLVAFRTLCIFALITLTCAAMLAAHPVFAWASNQEPSGEGDVLWTPHVSIDAEHDPENPGYIRIHAIGTNDSPTTIHGANLEFVLPDQAVIVKGDQSTSVESLDAGDSITAELVVTSVENANANPYQEPSAPSSSFAKTNDDLFTKTTIIAIIGLVAAAGILFAMRRRGRAHKAASGTMCVLLMAALATGLTPAFPQSSYADEATPATKGYSSVEIDMNGTPVEFGVSLSISSADEVPESAYPSTAWLSTKTYVAHDTTKAHVSITSDKVFAADLDASAFSLGEALADCTVTEASRTSDTQADLVIEGLAADDGTDGSIHATAAAFAEEVSEGFGVIPVEAPQATLADADEATEGWDENSSLFLIPVHIDCAEFSATAKASDFSLPSNPAITVQNADCTEGDHEALLSFSVPGPSPEDQLETLDAALTEGGVHIDAAATNCGELIAVSDDVSRAPEYGYETTALEYADATFFSRICIQDAHADIAEGPVTLVCEAIVETVDGGEVNLAGTESDLDVFEISTDDSGNIANGPSIVDQGSIHVTSQNSFTFETTLDASSNEGSAIEADAFWAILEDGDQCGNPLNHLQETAVRSDWVFSSCAVKLGDSNASNQWGVPLSNASAPALTDDEYQTLTRDGGFTDTEVASKALSAAQEALNAAGSFAKAIANEDLTEVFSGVGSVLGFVSKMVDISSPPQYTLADVMSRLDTMQESLNALEGGVSQLNMQLESFESRSAYRTAVAQLSSYTGILGEDDGIALLVRNALGKVDVKSGASSFAELSEADRKELRLLAESTRAYSQRHGTETIALTKGLGDLITGNAAISANGIGSLYFDYVDTYHNWEPQTFDARKQFLAYVGAAYINGYTDTASMCELNVELADAKAAGDESSVRAIENAQKTLAKQAGKVGEIISGEVDETGKLVSESKLSSRTHARADGGVLNLVTKSVFATESSNKAGMIAVSSVANHSGMDYDAVLKSRNIGRVNIDKLDTVISEAQFVDMGKRLKARSGQEGYTGPKNLSEEFGSLKIPLSKSFGSWSYDLGSNREAKVDASESQAHQHVVKLNSKKSTSDQFAVYHEIAQTGDVYDTKTDSVKRGVRIYKAWTKYYAGKFYWTLNIRFGDYRVWGASDGKSDADEENWEDDDDEEWDDDVVTD